LAATTWCQAIAVGEALCGPAAIARSLQAAALTLDRRIIAGDLTLHDPLQRQIGAMQERADLSDEKKQSILIAMSCPCCGAGGMSFTAKLKRGW
jgi:hypothetical protein